MAYEINKQYALSGNQGDSRQALKWFVIAHESGNEGDTKSDNAVVSETQYMKNNYQSAYTTHFVGGGGKIFQIGTPGFISWGALNANPYAVAQVELARTAKRSVFEKDYQAYIYLLRTMAKQFGIPLTLDNGGKNTKGIKTHDWISKTYGGSHNDPIGYLQRWGITQKQFAKDLKTGLNGLLDKHEAKKNINKKYDSNNYYQFNPILISINKKLGSFNQSNLAKDNFKQFIEANEILKVDKVEKIGSVSRLHTEKGWISGRKDFSSPYYLTDKDNANQVQVLDRQLNSYEEPNLKTKQGVLSKGSYGVIATKETATNKFSLQLKDKSWITSRKDLVKKLR